VTFVIDFSGELKSPGTVHRRLRPLCTSHSIYTSRTMPASAPKLRCLAIVPAFNERTSIDTLIHRLARALPGYDILVIDDGSTDDTAKRIPPPAVVISLPFNLGIGGAMQTGYRYAALHGYDIAVQVDGDGQHRPSEVIKLVDHLAGGDCDLVIGSRFLQSGHYHQTVVRSFGSWLLKSILHMLSGLLITDCTSGFRAANKKVINAFAHWYPEDYPEPETILLLHRAGFKITELPVRMRQRRGGQSSIRLLSGLFYVIKVTTCLMLDLVREPWPLGKVLSGGLGPGLEGKNESAHERDPLDHPAGSGFEPAHPRGDAAPRIQT
jgi:glycosyltransferase involved in cell wall biosynthesis